MSSHPAVEAAIALQPLIEKHVEAGEDRARLHPEVVQALGDAGLYRVCAPREVGGGDAIPSVILGVMEAVSRADPAAGWYVGNSMVACHVSARLEAPYRERLYAEPDRHFGTSAVPLGSARPADGGYRLSGRWPVVTGVEDSSWCALVGIVMENGAPRSAGGRPDVRTFLVPTQELEVLATWCEASGMRGTGSNAVEVHDVFVEEGFAHTSMKPIQIDRPVYRLPTTVVFAPAVGAAACGVLAGAIEAAGAALADKPASFSGQPQRDHAVVRELFAHSRAAWRGMRAGMYEIAAETEAALAADGTLSDSAKADTYGFMFHTAQVARTTISDLYAHGSRDAFFRGPVERAMRNLHAIHLGINGIRALLESSGSVGLGGAPTHPAF